MISCFLKNKQKKKAEEKAGKENITIFTVCYDQSWSWTNGDFSFSYMFYSGFRDARRILVCLVCVRADSPSVSTKSTGQLSNWLTILNWRHALRVIRSNLSRLFYKSIFTYEFMIPNVKVEVNIRNSYLDNCLTKIKILFFVSLKMVARL